LLAFTAVGYVFYEKNYHYGKPINYREVPESDDFYASNAASEYSMTFWNPSGNFHVSVIDFTSENDSQISFTEKYKIYLDGSQANN